MNGEKIRGAEIKTNNRFLRWLENYWYHYKWTTLIVAFFAIVAIICTMQMCTHKKQDISIVYAGPKALNAETADNLEGVMNFAMPEDFNRDGDKDTALVHYFLYSEEQIKQIEAQTNADGQSSGYVDKAYNSSSYDNFYSYMQTGESSVCLLDRSLFESLRDSGRLAKVSDTLGYLPEGASDEYGVRLGDLDIYSSYGVMRELPEDTVVCLLLPLIAGKSSDPEMYGYEKQMFAAIIEYTSEK